MKKILLILTFAFAVSFVNAQCTPDPQFSNAGIYPDSAAGLLPAYVGESYAQNITIITPLDTNVIYTGLSIEVTIDNIDLTEVIGLPTSFSYSCDPPNCSFAGGSTGCAELSSISPTLDEIGLHQIVFKTTTYVSGVPFIGTTTQDDVIDYYYLNVSDNSTSSINQFDNTSFELMDVYPNPILDQHASIQFVSGVSEDISFAIYNLLGKEIESKLISCVRGVNTINLNTLSYSEGIYLYSISNGHNVLMKRMIVSN
jgi:hypothetical protein